MYVNTEAIFFFKLKFRLLVRGQYRHGSSRDNQDFLHSISDNTMACSFFENDKFILFKLKVKYLRVSLQNSQRVRRTDIETNRD